MGLGETVRTALRAGFMKKNPAADDAEKYSVAGIWGSDTATPPDQFALDQQEQVHPVVYAATHVVAKDAAQPELKLDELLDDGEELRPVKSHPLIDCLQRINETQTPDDYWTTTVVDLQMAGNNYTYVNLGPPNARAPFGDPLDLMWMNPREVEPRKNKKTIIDGYTRTLPNGKGERFYPLEKVWHFKTSNRKSRYVGMGAAERIRDPIAIDQQMVKWRYSLFYNGVPVEILFRVGGQADEAKIQRATRVLEERLVGRNTNGRRFAVINADTWEVQLIPRPKEDETSYINGRALERALIAMVFGVPPNKLGDFTESSGLSTNADQQERLYWEDTVMGYHRIILDYLNFKVLRRYYPGDRNFRFRYDYSKVRALNTSEKERMDIVSRGVEIGLMHRNDGRKKLGMERITDDPMADVLMYHDKPLDAFEQQQEAAARQLEVVANQPAPQPQLEGPKPKPKTGEIVPLFKSPNELFDDLGDELIYRQMIQSEIARMVERAARLHLEAQGFAGAFNAEDPFVLDFIRRQTIRLAHEVTPTTNDSIRRAIAAGQQGGLPFFSREMRDLIRAAIGERRATWQIDRIAGTESHAAQEGGSFFAGLQNGFEFKRWLTSGKDNVRGNNPKDAASHVGLHGVVVAMRGAWTDPRSGARLRFPGDRDGAGDGPTPKGSDTINCFPGDTTVRGEFVAGLKAWYSGPMIELETARGHRLTLTPNHPVLTARGWIPATELREGDCLASHGEPVDDSATSRDVNDEHRESTIEEVFETLRGDTGAIAVQVSPLDLDGDARWTGQEIDIVGTDWGLGVELHPPAHGVGKREFVGAATSTSSERAGFEFGLRSLDATDRIPGFGELSHDHFGRSLHPRQPLGSASPADWNAVVVQERDDARTGKPVPGSHRQDTRSPEVVLDRGLLVRRRPARSVREPVRVGMFPQWDALPTKPSGERRTVDPDFLGKLTEASAGAIVEDKLVRVSRIPEWFGHVYDLQSASGYLITNGVVSSNCHCSWVADFAHLEDAPPESLAAGLAIPAHLKAWGEADTETFLETKGAQRDKFATSLGRITRSFLVAMERRFLERFDQLAAEQEHPIGGGVFGGD